MSREGRDSDMHVCADEVYVAVGIVTAVAPWCRSAWVRICKLCGRRVS